MVDASAQAFAASGIYRAGVSVTFKRLTGFAPNVATTSVTVTAIVRNVTADTSAETETGLSATAPGSITQDDRFVMVMASDLANAGFPLPLAKGDTVVLPSISEAMTVARVDADKRAMAGVIELVITGVS